MRCDEAAKGADEGAPPYGSSHSVVTRTTAAGGSASAAAASCSMSAAARPRDWPERRSRRGCERSSPAQANSRAQAGVSWRCVHAQLHASTAELQR